MKIFVTGASGVIGRRLVPALVQQGHEVSASARSAEQAAQLARGGVRALVLNLFDRTALDAALAHQEVVINLATHMPASTFKMFLPGAWRQNDRLRRVASAKLVEAALASGASRFIQESFAPAYPDCGSAWISETTALAPARYNRSLLDAERAAARFSEHGRTGVVLRFASFYGADARQLADLIRFVRAGYSPLPGAPQAYISSVSHDDAASAVLAALELPAGTYNVADDEPLTHRDYLDSLASALGVAPPKFAPAWLAILAGSLGELLSRSQRISNRALRAASTWRPEYPSARRGWTAAVRAFSG
jgi:nucleoside-diphosphate-sugar epimerase